jgi:hypothetical protein
VDDGPEKMKSHFLQEVAIAEFFILFIGIDYFTDLPFEWFFLLSLYPYMSFPTAAADKRRKPLAS